MISQIDHPDQEDALITKINPERFIAQVFHIKESSTGDAAKLRNGLSESKKIKAWEVLITLGYSIAIERNEVILRTIAASVTKSKFAENGDVHFAEGLRQLRVGSASTDLYFQRILACKNSQQVCHILPRLLNLLQSKGIPLDYIRLTRDLIFFDSNTEKTKATWAEIFYKPYKKANGAE